MGSLSLISKELTRKIKIMNFLAVAFLLALIATKGSSSPFDTTDLVPDSDNQEDHCNPNPCQNGGQCAVIGDQSVMCDCDTGFTGSFCEEKMCDGGDSCCGAKWHKCGEGEGDCDYDTDCQNGLTCGLDNCVGDSFDETDDCCEGPVQVGYAEMTHPGYMPSRG